MGMDLFIPAKKNGEEDESLASFVRRRLGQEALDKLAEPLVAGIHGGDPETMSLKSSFPRFLQIEQKYGSLIKGMLASKKFTAPAKPAGPPSRPNLTFFTSFIGCMTDLVDAVAGSLKNVEIRLNKEVKAVYRTGDSKFHVVEEVGEPDFFDSVIVTSPAYASSKILRSLDHELSDALDSIPYTNSATISLAFDESKLTKRPKGFGFVVPQVERRKILAATFSSIKWANRAPEGKLLIRCFLGSARGDQKLVDLNDDDMQKLATAELKSILGLNAEPEFSRVFRWYRSMPQYTVGHLERTDALMKRLEEDYPGIYVTGAAFYGVGVGDCIHNGWTAADKAFEHANKRLCDERYEQSEDLIGDV